MEHFSGCYAEVACTKIRMGPKLDRLGNLFIIVVLIIGIVLKK
jgi:hypothetical protein